MALTAIDNGFNFVKALSDNGRQCIFPSVIGMSSLARQTFSIPQAKQSRMGIAFEDGQTWLVGNTAIQHSVAGGRRDPGWVLSQAWEVLLCAAFSELYQARASTYVVTGLPLEDWSAWSDKLRARLIGPHRFKRNGGAWQTITVEDAMVITQAYSSLLDQAMSDSGRILTNVFSTGMVAVADIGGNTLNLLVADNLEEIGQWTQGDGLGLLKALDQVARDIHATYPGIRPKAREVSQWLAAGTFAVDGKAVDIGPFAKPHLDPLAEMVVNRLSEVWSEPGRFSAVLLTGGGSLALGQTLKAKMEGVYPNVTIAHNAQFSNCQGYLKLARDMWG